jgi:hypothetical protein
VPFRQRPLLSRFTVVAAPKEIIDLIERFDQQIDAYKSGQYNETQLRREFLNPFFEYLCWNIAPDEGARRPKSYTPGNFI